MKPACVSVNLTVEIAAHQLEAQSGPEFKVRWLNSDVASDKRWKEAVVFHLGAVHVAVKCLNREKHFSVMKLSTTCW